MSAVVRAPQSGIVSHHNIQPFKNVKKWRRGQLHVVGTPPSMGPMKYPFITIERQRKKRNVTWTSGPLGPGSDILVSNGAFVEKGAPIATVKQDYPMKKERRKDKASRALMDKARTILNKSTSFEVRGPKLKAPPVIKMSREDKDDANLALVNAAEGFNPMLSQTYSTEWIDLVTKNNTYGVTMRFWINDDCRIIKVQCGQSVVRIVCIPCPGGKYKGRPWIVVENGDSAAVKPQKTAYKAYLAVVRELWGAETGSRKRQDNEMSAAEGVCVIDHSDAELTYA